MKTHGAFDRPQPGDRFRARWYGMSRAARVNKLLFLAAGISLVAFINVANRGPGPPTGLSAGSMPRPTVGGLPSSTVLQTAGLPSGEAPVTPPPSATSTTSTPATRPRAPTSTVSPERAPSPPGTSGDPGVVFSPPPSTPPPTTPPTAAPPVTPPPTTAQPGTTTTAAPTTTAPPTTAPPPPSSTTTTTAARSILQVLFGG